MATILPDLAGKSTADLIAIINALALANAAPLARIPVKTSAKGCVAFTGVRAQRGGASFYPGEWLAICDALPAILRHILADTVTSGTYSETAGGPKLPYSAAPSYRDTDNREAICAKLSAILAKLEA
jgi:hypothetical protein